MQSRNLIRLFKESLKYHLVIITLLAPGYILANDSSSKYDSTAIDAFLRKCVNKYNIPGLSVVIVDAENTLFLSAFGESSKGTSFSVYTPSYIGSTTKSFTALSILSLVEEGKLELDSPIKKYLPEFTLYTHEYEDLITIRHLLNHTSGLSDAGMPYTSLGEKSLEEELFLLRQCKPRAAPGVSFEYFNDNYRLLGVIIERVSGMKFGEYVAEKIFKPIGMTSSFAGQVVNERVAEGYGELFGFPFRREQRYRGGALPSGYICTSASDLSLFLKEELSAGCGDTSHFKSGMIELTWQPPGNIKSNYGMGWMVFDTIGKTPFFAHGGSLENYQSFFYLNPQLNVGFAFLINQGGILPMFGGFSAIRNGLIKIIDGEVPEEGKGKLVVILVTLIFLLILGCELYLTFLLRRRKAKLERQKKWRTWFILTIDLVITVFLVYWCIKGGFMFYSLLPELLLLMWIMVLIGVIRTYFRFHFLLGSRLR